MFVLAPAGEQTPAMVGYTNDMRKRFSVLQAAHWRELDTAALYWFPAAIAAKRVEVAAAARLKREGRLIRGAWFDVSGAYAASVVVECAVAMGGDWFDEAERHRRIARMKHRHGERIVGLRTGA